MPSIRTFIAVETPLEIREKIQKLQTELKKAKSDVRWESMEKFHATIKFLGDIDEQKLPAVLTRIKSVIERHRSFELIVQTIGCFPNAKHPRVVWIGCTNADGVLDLLKTSLDVELLPLGFEIEDRAFHPHITLGRVKSSKGISNLTSMMEKLTFEPTKFEVKEIVIMKSVLRPEGSEYSALLNIHLQGK